MASLRLTTTGMSFLIDGLDVPNLDADRLGRELSASYGIAAATIGAEADSPSKPVALLVDRERASWNGLKHWLETRIREQNLVPTSWEEVQPGRLAYLHFPDA